MGTRHLYWILTGPSFAVCISHFAIHQPPFFPSAWLKGRACENIYIMLHRSVSAQVTMELDLQSFLGSCVQLYSLAETRNSPLLPAFVLIYEFASGRPRQMTSLCNPLIGDVFMPIQIQVRIRHSLLTRLCESRQRSVPKTTSRLQKTNFQYT